MPSALTRRRGARGYVLIAVLWLGVALLTGMAAFLSSARQEAMTARAEIAALRADALARSGLNLALARLADALGPTEDGAPDPGRAMPRDGRPVVLEMAEGRVAIRVEDEAGKVDLRHAPPQLLGPVLASLGRSTGIDAFAATNLAQGFGEVNPMGDGRPMDLALLLRGAGLDARATALAGRHLTLLNGTPKVDPRTASRVVLAAVPGLGPSDVETIVARREGGDALPQLGSANVWLAQRQGPIYTIRVRAELATGGVGRIDAVVGARGLSFREGATRFDVLTLERPLGDDF